MITLRKFALVLLLGATALGMASTSVSANTITMQNYNGGAGTVECTLSCLGFDGTGPTTLSMSLAMDFPLNGNPTAELAKLNELLDGFNPARPQVNYVNKTDVAGNSFTTDRQYFSIKQSTEIWYFENTSGGTLTVELVNTNDYSHWTEYGQISAVPVPAAFWLFGTALIGFIGVSRRRKVA